MIVQTLIGLALLFCVVAIILFGCVLINRWEERQEAVTEKISSKN